MITFLGNLVLGWAGSILVNYLADVLPVHRRLIRPYCLGCQSQNTWRQYLYLAPCDDCGRRLSTRHLVVLILGPVLAGLVYFFPIENLGNYGAQLWMSYFGLVVIIDLEHRLILHPVSLVGGLLGAIFGSFNHGLVNTLLGGAAGFGIMLVFYYLGELFVHLVSKSRGEEITEIALGFGDVNLAGVIGLLLGWPGIVGGLFLAIFLGGIVSGLFLLVQSVRKKYQAFQALPYGPFLVLSAVVLFYISQIVR
jgi:leader peptidase (prepilin peptidase)/N-methyltransferase